MIGRTVAGILLSPKREAISDAQRPLPRHVAIIMDGNGRWAANHGMPRVEGHRRGVEAVRRTLRAAGEMGIEILTLYSFSLENWTRPVAEVSDLMNLMRRFIREDIAELNANNVRIKVIGSRNHLAPDVSKLLCDAVQLTSGNTGLQLIVAFNYGARQEIAEAVRLIAEQVLRGELDPSEITPELVEGQLDTAGIPDPDLVLRTSGEQRLSNFLLWQAAYSEFVFLPVLWPDFDRSYLEAAIREYRSRERRFGGTAAAAG